MGQMPLLDGFTNQQLIFECSTYPKPCGMQRQQGLRCISTEITGRSGMSVNQYKGHIIDTQRHHLYQCFS
jgi:hypothetical protein